MSKLSTSLESFLASPDFELGCTQATRAAWGGSSYKVELFTDGTWRVLWSNEIGNLYSTPGVILSLPTMDDEEYQEAVIDGDMSEDEFFAAAFSVEKNDLKSEMRQSFRDRI